MYYQPQIDFRPDQVLAYLRKSQSDDPLLTVEEVLAKHETILDEWAQRTLGGVVPEENKFREVVSGETIKGRPEVQKVLRLMESPRIRAILVVEPQRLTRGDLEDIGRMMKLLKHTHTLVLTPPRSYDLSDEYDWDAFERELKRGNDYLEYTKKILNRGRLLSVSQGNYIGSHPPYGYDRVFVTEGKRKYPTLTENKAQADVVRMIFHWYVDEDLGYQKICHRLDGMGIQPPRSEYWSPAALKDLLSNVHYVGKVRWNWRKTVTHRLRQRDHQHQAQGPGRRVSGVRGKAPRHRAGGPLPGGPGEAGPEPPGQGKRPGRQSPGWTAVLPVRPRHGLPHLYQGRRGALRPPAPVSESV